jgi:hypothetical protein
MSSVVKPSVIMLTVVALWLVALGSWLLAPGSWLLATGSWLLAPGYWLLAPGYWLLAPGSWLLAPGSVLQEHLLNISAYNVKGSLGEIYHELHTFRAPATSRMVVL